MMHSLMVGFGVDNNASNLKGLHLKDTRDAAYVIAALLFHGRPKTLTYRVSAKKIYVGIKEGGKNDNLSAPCLAVN